MVTYCANHSMFLKIIMPDQLHYSFKKKLWGAVSLLNSRDSSGYPVFRRQLFNSPCAKWKTA